MTAYLITLEGQGDEIIYLVDKETWDWIFSPLGTPTPDTVLKDLRESNEKNYPDMGLSNTIDETPGSYDNDRALQCCTTLTIDGEKTPQFTSMKQYTSFMQKHPEIELEDTFSGYIY